MSTQEQHWNTCWEPGMKCENDSCNEPLPQDLAGNLCSGYMDTSEGERWCNCCDKCRTECHNGALEEINTTPVEGMKQK